MVVNSLSFVLQLLSQYTRPFLVKGRNIEVLYSPDRFFNLLKAGVLGAQRRVVFSSLYLGTGTRETELVECFRSNLTDRKNLKCTLLLDHLRGLRGQPNSRTMVQDLVTQFGSRFTLGLYHTPNLRGILKTVGPERFNEVMGLQHMKIYLFDDDIFLSGANLSRDYFVDRQDRYVLFRDCRELANFFADIVNATLAHSYTLDCDGSIIKPSALPHDPLQSRKAAKAFKSSLSRSVKELTVPSCSERKITLADLESESSSSTDLDTVVCPMIQMGFCDIKQDETVTRKLLSSLSNEDTLYLASGYFNLPPSYSEAILQAAGRECNILAASPEANGFYGAKGVAGHVPVMYIHFARKFLEQVAASKNEGRVNYLEYFRPGWTFHGKGMWLYAANETHPSVTLVGSSNYGHRSLTRDLEAQVAIVTRNRDLRAALHEEQQHMFKYARELTLRDVLHDRTRRLSLWEWVATSLLQQHV